MLQGDLGSDKLKPRPTGITWKAGGTANVSWYIAFNHVKKQRPAMRQ